MKIGQHTIKFKWFTLLLLFLFSVFHLIIAILNHYYFRTFTFDYGVYNFAFYQFAHAKLAAVPLYNVFVAYPIHFLQDHFSLTLLILSPLYWLSANVFGSYLLILIQWAFVVFGAWSTYKLIVYKCKLEWLGFLALIYYFVLYGRYSAYQSDCNLAIIGAAMLPVFLYYFEIKHTWGTIISFAFLLLNREDFPLCLMFICLYLMLVNRKNTTLFKLSSLLAATSLIAFVVILYFIIPALEDDNKKFGLFEYSALGSSVGEALAFMFQHPLKTISYLFVNHSGYPEHDTEKAGFYILYGLSGGLILLLRPAYLICFIPIIAKKMFNDNPVRWGYELYYSIEIASLLPIFVFSILAEIKNKHLKLISAISLCVSTFAITYYAISISFNNGLGNYKYNVFSKEFYRTPAYIKRTHTVLQMIPENAVVCATGDLIPHLAYRNKIYYYPSIEDSEFLCINSAANWYPVSKESFNAKLNEFLRSPEWKLIAVSGTVMLLKKVSIAP